MQHSELLDALIPVALEAGGLIMAIHAEGVEADFKGDGSPVTRADRAAETIILKALAQLVPDIPVVSEENAASHALAASDRFLLVDPVDGTREFLRADGQGAFTVNIALVEQGQPVLGVVHAPALDRCFAGARGQGVKELHAGQSRSVGVRAVPEGGAVAVASRSHRDQATNDWLAQHGIEQTIATGSSLKFCLVACGEADVYPRFGPTMEWDTAAGDAVLRAAGGEVQNPDGTPFVYGKPDYRNGGFIALGGFKAA